jgi:hypothetical protein
VTIKDFKYPKQKYEVMAYDLETGEVYNAIIEKVLASIASQFKISNEEALRWLDYRYWNKPHEIICQDKHTSFWVENCT